MTGVRPLNRNQQLQHRAFLTALGRTGNVLMAAREAGVSDATLHGRRKRYPAFAQAWDAALVAAKARLHRRGGAQSAAGGGPRAAGGEPTVTLLANGRLQVRAARRGSLTKQCEQAFLAALSATANISLSAAAAGASVASFTRRRRCDPGFAREFRLALEQGWQRLNEALIEGFLPESHQDDAWRHNDPPAAPRMTTQQALQLMYLHQKQVVLGEERIAPKERRGDPRVVARARQADAYRRHIVKRAEDMVTDALVRALDALPPSPHEVPPALPDLDQVTGWSAADPAKAPHGDRALFGGWRETDQSPDRCAAALEQGRRTASGHGRRAARRDAERARIVAAAAEHEAAEHAAANARERAARDGGGVEN